MIMSFACQDERSESGNGCFEQPLGHVLISKLCSNFTRRSHAIGVLFVVPIYGYFLNICFQPVEVKYH